jgi:hypothetical protein
MWDYPFEAGDARRFLVIGRGQPSVAADAPKLTNRLGFCAYPPGCR